MLKHNTYFEGKVQSVGFLRHDRKQSVGVVAPGEYRFDTAAAERMHVISGEFEVKREDEAAFSRIGAGTYFEIRANSYFDIKTSEPSAYLCEYL
jgi:purine/pyrimidine-nucleoside phosphorylase